MLFELRPWSDDEVSTVRGSGWVPGADWQCRNPSATADGTDLMTLSVSNSQTGWYRQVLATSQF
jgi:hypothetical protein